MGRANKFLIASPTMKDPVFERTVILLVADDPKGGTFGVVINQPLQISPQEVFAQRGFSDVSTDSIVQIGRGGPVEPSHGFVVHSGSPRWAVTLYHDENKTVTGSPDVIDAIARNEGPEKVFIAVGCAAWVPGQLDSELESGAWLVVDADDAVIFDLPFDRRYEAALALAGQNVSDQADLSERAFSVTSTAHA